MNGLWNSGKWFLDWRATWGLFSSRISVKSRIHPRACLYLHPATDYGLYSAICGILTSNSEIPMLWLHGDYGIDSSHGANGWVAMLSWVKARKSWQPYLCIDLEGTTPPHLPRNWSSRRPCRSLLPCSCLNIMLNYAACAECALGLGKSVSAQWYTSMLVGWI